MSEQSMEPFLLGLAQEAMAIALKWRTTAAATIKQHDGSPVTEADQEINRLIIDRFGKAFPEILVMGEEESSGPPEAELVAVVDPLDGTKLYSIFSPTFTAPAIAVMERSSGKILHAVVGNPVEGCVYWATRGSGAWVSSMPEQKQRIRVSDHQMVGGSTVFAQNRVSSAFNAFSVGEALTRQGSNNLALGSIVFEAMLIACGGSAITLPPVAALYYQQHPWDIAAAKLIVEEAGGVVTDFKGNPVHPLEQFAGAIFSNGRVHHEIVRLTRSLVARSTKKPLLSEYDLYRAY